MRFLNISNGGETTRFYTCQTCFASVQPGDREDHDRWHKIQEGKCFKCEADANVVLYCTKDYQEQRTKPHPVTADRFSRFLDSD